ncbi:MFS transporter [Brevibacterium rongguiense]|uniref:MFS transporter n=1 Tax=Brevibacterium rongguiense TaxID=2695267 RepID=UPI001925B41B|nr:MFS transporter [Brevibacterium rongguiense]
MTAQKPIRASRRRWRATVAVAMSNYIEAGSIIAIATSLTMWQEKFGLTSLAVGLLAALSANAFGAAIGSAIGGPLSDRYGRKFIYTYDLLLYMVGALLAVFAVNFAILLTAFIAMGIAVGAGVTAAWTYIAEEAPDGQRAAHVGVAQLAWSIGPMVGFLLAIVVGPLGLLGSRIVFAHLFVIAFITWWVRRGLEESERWKAHRDDPNRQGYWKSVGQLFTKKRNLTALAFLIGVYGLWNTVAGQAGIFQPRVYEATGLTDPAQQNWLQVLVWGLTSLFTVIGFMKFGDRVSRRWLYFVFALIGIIAWAVLIYSPPGYFSLFAFAIGWGISSGVGAQAFYGLWTAELFATRYRASAQGFLFMLARVMVGVLSLWFPLMLESIGLHGLGTLIIALLVAALLIGTIWAPNTSGKTLEEIEEERYGTRAAIRPSLAAEALAAAAPAAGTSAARDGSPQ